MTSSPPSSGLSPAVLPESPPLRVGNRQQGLRSLKNLISHFTARADDSHATPVHRPRRAADSHPHSSVCRAHRLLCGLPGYLNLFAPRTFAPQRQYMARCSPSPPVFFQISTDFTPTPGIPTSPPVLQTCSFQRITGLSPALLHQTCTPACAPFTPNNSEQRSPPTYYRGCWHVVSRGLFLDSRHQQAIPCLPYSPSRKELYNLTASVPMWPSTLSGRLPIVALVGLYPAN